MVADWVCGLLNPMCLTTSVSYERFHLAGFSSCLEYGSKLWASEQSRA